MRKKLLSSILVITMAANLLTGCGSGKDSDTVSKEEASQEEGVICLLYTSPSPRDCS